MTDLRWRSRDFLRREFLGRRLPRSGFLTESQERMAMAHAHIIFHAFEDKEDFMQSFYCFAWESWLRRGKKTFSGKDDRPDIDLLTFLFSKARRAVRGRRKTEEAHESIDTLATQNQITVWDMKNPNEKFAIKDRLWKLKLENGSEVRMSYADLEEYTGMKINSIGRSRRINRPIKAVIFEGQIYPSLKVVQEKYGLTEAAARWRSKTYNFRWAEAAHTGVGNESCERSFRHIQ